MSVNSINISALANSYGAYNQKLTNQTKAQLDKLGIIYNANITEAQGQALLKTAQQSQTQNNSSNNQNNQNNDPLYKKALELAKQLGINPNEQTSFNDLLKKIESTLEAKIKSSENDEEKLNQLKSLCRTLADIQAQSTGSMGYDTTNKALEMTLDLLGQYNKNFVNRY